jgi:hypothetical protein
MGNTTGTGECLVCTSAKPATLMANLRSVIRLDLPERDTKPFCLVFDEGLQLIERPVAYPVIHPLASPLLPYPFKVLHVDAVTCNQSTDYLLADVMIDPSHITSFSAFDCSEQSLCASSAFGLKNRTQMPELALHLLGFRGVEEPAVRADGKVVYSEVNAKNTTLQVRDFDIDLFGKHEQEIASAFLVHPQQALSEFPAKILLEMSREFDSNILPPCKSAQIEDTTIKRGRAWEVVSDARSCDGWLGLCFLHNTTGLLDACDSQLSGQGLSQASIDKRMQLDVVLDAMLPSNIHTMLQASSICRDSLNYLWICSDFDFSCCTNLHSVGDATIVFKLCEVNWQFLPIASYGVSLPY